jgi:hypothetical protein
MPVADVGTALGCLRRPLKNGVSRIGGVQLNPLCQVVADPVSRETVGGLCRAALGALSQPSSATGSAGTATLAVRCLMR